MVAVTIVGAGGCQSVRVANDLPNLRAEFPSIAQYRVRLQLRELRGRALAQLKRNNCSGVEIGRLTR